MSLLNYLNEQFYCAQILCQSLAIEQGTLAEWQQKRLFPKPSYCIENRIQCSSYYGLHECLETTDYYPRGAINWGKLLLKNKINSATAACDLFMQQYALSLNQLPVDLGLDEEYENELSDRLTSDCQQFMTGKYGAQTASGSIDDLVALEAARYRIDTITEALTLESLDQQQRTLLHPALKLINKALGHCPEHETLSSLRRRYVENLILKYDLSLKG